MYLINVTQKNGYSWSICVDSFSVKHKKHAILLRAMTHQEHFDGCPVPECYEWDDVKKLSVKEM